jgi:hypothetical protein
VVVEGSVVAVGVRSVSMLAGLCCV